MIKQLMWFFYDIIKKGDNMDKYILDWLKVIDGIKNDNTYKFLVSSTHEKLVAISTVISEKQISS